MTAEGEGDGATLAPDLSRDGARRRVVTLLAEVSGKEAPLDARILLEDATGLDRAALLRDGDRPLGVQAAERLGRAVARRLAGEPVWQILGEREFWGLRFAVTPDVLDPRPDTETLVRAALEAMSFRAGQPLRVADLGVGSGAILGALLHEMAQAFGVGVDRSEAACRVAWRNCQALGLSSRAQVINASWADALANGRFDLVVSNPPYIETATLPLLPREVRDFDPPAALDGGADGLECYRTIATELPRLLAPGGIAVFEVGAGQSAAVAALMEAAGLTIQGVHRDLGGHERAVVARRSNPPSS